MSVQLPYLFDSSPDHLFFQTPSLFGINKHFTMNYMTNQKIEVLIEELKAKGPLIGWGEFGPNVYSTPPSKLDEQICGFDIYGWQPGSVKAPYPKMAAILILGIKKVKECHYVYFILSQKVAMHQTLLIPLHQASKTDTNVYAVSHQAFRFF